MINKLVTNVSSSQSKLIQTLKSETEASGINFLAHYGFREFYFDGTTVGTSSNDDWNKKALNLSLKAEMEQHYFRELQQVMQSNLPYIIRTRDRIVSDFQRKLLTVNMSNSLGVYKKTLNSIRGYYFISDPEDYHSQIFIINNLSLFNKITNVVGNTLNKNTLLLKELFFTKFQLFTDHQVTKILSNKKLGTISNISLILNGRKFLFTPKEAELLEVIKYGCTTKDLASSLNISPRTAEWHLQKIKLKLGTSSKLAIIEFAQKASII